LHLSNSKGIHAFVGYAENIEAKGGTGSRVWDAVWLLTRDIGVPEQRIMLAFSMAK
jgi:hypothetical protein